ncbi:signal peptidase I [Flintibacter muris]|uniref:signal peptidase I n=1 Tax=Flintibacter muris TaxID=2941327 RepID=UPI0020410E4B|nr:signal peptidase I [Flintibacter muris]
MDEYNNPVRRPPWLQSPEEEIEEQEEPRRPGAEVYDWLQLFLGCVIAAVVLFNCVARLTRVDGSSMDNTLRHGEVMLIWSLGYTPKQGDIVVLNKTSVILQGWSEPRAIVKRVVATGGQTVDIDYAAGVVYVDGQPLDEPYLPEEMHLPYGPTMQGTHWEVPEGSVFVLGDNRNNSTDSRDVQLGPINTDYILGKAVFALWPLDRFGIV